MNAKPKTLDALLAALTAREIEITDSLPTYGGAAPDDTREIWSWDETRILVGTCADDLQIEER